MIKTFAAGYSRNEQGWLEFPRDLTTRRKYLPPEIFKDVSMHPSKMNLFLCQEIIRYVSEPEETILDPFGGIGTTMIAALEGRHVILIELEEEYYRLQNETLNYWKSKGWEPATLILLQGDNRRALPIPCNHIITSPPYGNDTAKAEGALVRKIGDESDTRQQEIAQYGSENQSISRLNPFMYVKAMEKVYKLMVDSLLPNGTLTITHRDRKREDKRILYANDIIRTVTGYGMKLMDIQKWKAPGSIQSRVNEKLGIESILDEDIIFFKKI